MPQDVYIVARPVVDVQDKVGSVSVSANSTKTKLAFDDGATFFMAKTGRRGRIAQVANSVQAGGESVITFHVYVNGNPVQVVPYNSFQQALGETYKSDGRLAVPIDIPQGALIEVLADNSDPATAYSAYIRIRVEYEDLN